MGDPLFSYISLSSPSIGDEILWWVLYRHEDNEGSLTCAFEAWVSYLFSLRVVFMLGGFLFQERVDRLFVVYLTRLGIIC